MGSVWMARCPFLILTLSQHEPIACWGVSRGQDHHDRDLNGGCLGPDMRPPWMVEGCHDTRGGLPGVRADSCLAGAAVTVPQPTLAGRCADALGVVQAAVAL